MQYKNLVIISLMVFLLIGIVSAEGFSDINKIKDTPIKDKYIDKEIIKSDGIYVNNIKITNKKDARVYIDKKVGDVYHVDSDHDFDKKNNESVLLEFYYEIQPDSIAHFTHSGKFDRYYFPSQWDWENDCEGEICSGGWVTIEVFNVERGYGSSTFPIGITGPTWARQGQDYGVFNRAPSVSFSPLSEINSSNNFSISFFAKDNDISLEGIFANNFNAANKFSITTSNSVLSISFSQDDSIFLGNASGLTTRGEWYNAIYVYNGSDGKLYINNILQSGRVVKYHNALLNARLGGNAGTSIRYNGSIDEVLIYNRSLSTAEITKLYANYSVTATGIKRTGVHSTYGLIFDMDFDDFSLADKSGNGNHGTNDNGVSFGIVEEVYRTLTNAVDYTINPTTGLFTIVNTDYLYSWLSLTWTYSEYFNGPVNNLRGNFTQGIDNVSSKIPVLFSVLMIVILLGILGLFYVIYKKMSNVGGSI